MKCLYCDKICKNENSKRNHERLCKSNPDRQIAKIEEARKQSMKKIPCGYCEKQISKVNIKKHETSCKSNPVNLRECPVCKIKHAKKGVTCSYSCSNTYFKEVRNKDERLGYQALCFRYHGKKCIVCGEEKIVAAHHVNEDHHDNRVENLVPLCPTHHSYVHSRYKDEVQPHIDKFISEFSSAC